MQDTSNPLTEKSVVSTRDCTKIVKIFESHLQTICDGLADLEERVKELESRI